MSAILKFDFQNREHLRLSEVNYLNYKKKKKKKKKKKSKFTCGNYIFPKTRGNTNKPWTHSTPLKEFVTLRCKTCYSCFTVHSSLTPSVSD